jgi:hypothetical protein
MSIGMDASTIIAIGLREELADCAKHVSKLTRENAELTVEVDRMRSFIEMRGYRRCDIPACNCNLWHGGNAEQRLSEIHDQLDVQGQTTLTAIKAIQAEVETMRPVVQAAENFRDGHGGRRPVMLMVSAVDDYRRAKEAQRGTTSI